jgi:hypothetical protein
LEKEVESEPLATANSTFEEKYSQHATIIIEQSSSSQRQQQQQKLLMYMVNK